MPPRTQPSSMLSTHINKGVLFLLVILIAGFFLRIHLAPSAAHSDTIAVRSWMESSVKFGLVRSYSEQVSTGWLPNYPPLSIMILEATGYAYKWLISADYIVMDPTHMVFAKMPGILSDILSSFILFFIVKKLKNEKAGFLASGIYLLHPAVLWNSTLWGQTDGIYTVFILASFYAMTRRHYAGATVLTVLACLVKVQAILFLPLILFMLPWDRKTITRSFFFSLCSIIIIFLPFLLGGSMQKVIQSYFVFDVLRESHLSWNAFNIWWMIYWPHAWEMRGTDTFFLHVSFNTFAIIAFGAIYGALLIRWRKSLRSPAKDHERTISLFFVASLIAFTSFMIGTQMHERYLFPFVAFALPLLFVHWRFIILYIGVSFLYLLNVTSSFPYTQLAASLFERLPNIPLFLAVLQTVFFLLFWIAALKYSRHVVSNVPLKHDFVIRKWLRSINFFVQWIRKLHPAVLLSGIVLLGLCLRLSLFPMEGYSYDTNLYKNWSMSAAEFGPSNSYKEQLFDNMKPDYPPFSMLMFWTIGKTASVIPSCGQHSPCLHLLVKLPSIIADLLAVVILYAFLSPMIGTKKALIGAAIYAFHPVTFYVSSVWGQTDAIFSMLLLACLVLCVERQWIFAGAYAALAVTTKFQAIILFPLLPFLLPLNRKAWIQSAGGFFFMASIVLLPFIVSPHGLESVVEMYRGSIGRYAVLSANAYNLWWALFSGDAGGKSSMDPVLGFLTYRMIATLLVAASYLFIIPTLFRALHAHRSKDRAAAIFLAAGSLAFAFFLFNTEMHERYSFPFITLFFPVLFLRRGYREIYIASSCLIFFNILGVLPLSPLDKWLFATFPNFRGMIAAFLVCVFFVLLKKMKQDARILNASLAQPWTLRPLLVRKKKLKRKRTR